MASEADQEVTLVSSDGVELKTGTVASKVW